MSDPKIQTPGDTGPTATSALEALLSGTVPDIAASLDECSDDDLAALAVLEAENTNRKGVLDAIALEQRRRKIAADELAAEQGDAAPTGYEAAEPDPAESYRHLSAREIEAAKLTQPVLSRDGWVMPKPAATPGA